MAEQFLVIGGDAAGMSAAGKAKRDDPEREVVVLERGDWVSYGACGLPYYVKGEIADVEDLLAVDPRTFVEERGIDLRRHHEAVAIDPEERTVTVEADGDRYEEPYDDLLLATGGRAALPAVPGADLEGVFSIRSLEAGRALRDYVAPHDAPPDPAGDPDRAAEVRTHLDRTEVDAVGVVGANKIGIELAEAFLARGLDVHVFDGGERVLPAFGADVAGMVEEHLREGGVELHLETAIERFVGEGDRVSERQRASASTPERNSRGGRVTGVETADGVVAVDAVVADVGVDPNVE